MLAAHKRSSEVGVLVSLAKLDAPGDRRPSRQQPTDAAMFQGEGVDMEIATELSHATSTSYEGMPCFPSARLEDPPRSTLLPGGLGGTAQPPESGLSALRRCNIRGFF